MKDVLLVPSSSPTFSPIHDGLDASVTSDITCFHLNYGTVSRPIYKLSSTVHYTAVPRIKLCMYTAVYNSTRVDEARKMPNSSRDKNEGAYCSGEGGEGPAMWPRI